MLSTYSNSMPHNCSGHLPYFICLCERDSINDQGIKMQCSNCSVQLGGTQRSSRHVYFNLRNAFKIKDFTLLLLCSDVQVV